MLGIPDKTTCESFLPQILNHEEADVLVPIKVDISHHNGRYMDSFTWNLYKSMLSPEEFAFKICVEENLPSELIPRIADQIQEQVDAFLSLVDLIVYSGSSNEEVIKRLLKKVLIDVSVRSNVTDYSDIFQLDAYSSGCDPEGFAKQTCLDLGLPCEMQPVIALQIRERIVRALLDGLEEKSHVFETPISDLVSKISLKLLSPQDVVNQLSTLCTELSPSCSPVETGQTAVTLPTNDLTNASAWM